MRLLKGRSQIRLARISAPLKPQTAPWYVRHPVSPGLERQFPASGWYWIPAGHSVAVFLAQSFELASYHLRTMVDREDIP